jgi:hypothetical protein
MTRIDDEDRLGILYLVDYRAIVFVQVMWVAADFLVARAAVFGKICDAAKGDAVFIGMLLDVRRDRFNRFAFRIQMDRSDFSMVDPKPDLFRHDCLSSVVDRLKRRVVYGCRQTVDNPVSRLAISENGSNRDTV